MATATVPSKTLTLALSEEEARSVLALIGGQNHAALQELCSMSVHKSSELYKDAARLEEIHDVLLNALESE